VFSLVASGLRKVVVKRLMLWDGENQGEIL
jgi:hypothetical protein